MLKIINNLTPFFEDCYRRIGVREYARLMDVSPPTASKMLSEYKSENILSKDGFRRHIFYYTNKNSEIFIELSRLYWRYKLKGLIEFLISNLTDPTIILFGSLSKAEVKNDSDIDLAVFAYKKDLNLDIFEKKFKRSIQLFWFKSLKNVKNKELASNIVNGYILSGGMVL